MNIEWLFTLLICSREKPKDYISERRTNLSYRIVVLYCYYLTDTRLGYGCFIFYYITDTHIGYIVQVFHIVFTITYTHL